MKKTYKEFMSEAKLVSRHQLGTDLENKDVDYKVTRVTGGVEYEIGYNSVIVIIGYRGLSSVRTIDGKTVISNPKSIKVVDSDNIVVTDKNNKKTDIKVN